MKYLFDNNIQKYGIKELENGLTFEILKEKFFWILKAKIKDAILGISDFERLIWRDGIWYDGIWMDGSWEKGTWENGIWFSCCWHEGKLKDGLWKGGTWKNGTVF